MFHQIDMINAIDKNEENYSITYSSWRTLWYTQSKLSDKKYLLETIAFHLFYKYGLYNWDFSFFKSKNCQGQCFYNDFYIQISEDFINSPTCYFEDVFDTLLHEIAHALTPPHSKEPDHGKTWKEICINIGAKPVACGESFYIYKWIHTCKCKESFSIRNIKRFCKICDQKMDCNINPDYSYINN